MTHMYACDYHSFGEKFNIYITASDDNEAKKKLFELNLILSKTISGKTQAIRYLDYCLGEHSGNDKMEWIGVAFSNDEALCLKRYICDNNDYVRKIKKNPMKSALFGILKAPFKAPITMTKSISSDALEIIQSLKSIFGTTRDAVQELKQSRSTRVINGELYVLEDIFVKVEISKLKLILIALIATILTVISLYYNSMPLALRYITGMFAFIGWMSVSHQILNLMMKESKNGKR